MPTTAQRLPDAGRPHRPAPSPAPAPAPAPAPPRPAPGTRRGTRIGYASGALVTGSFTTLPGLLLLPYLTDTLGIGAGLAGTLVLLPKLWDVLLTPLAGRLADRTRGRSGGRRLHVLVGGLGTAAAFALMFAGAAAGTAGALWTAAGFLLTATAFAFFHASYAALPAELTDSAPDRVRLVGGRVAGIAVAAILAAGVTPALVGAGGGGIEGHRWAGVFAAVLVTAGTIGVFRGTARTAAARPTPPRGADRAPGTPAGTGIPTGTPAETGAAAEEPGAAARRRLLRAHPAFAALLRCATVQVVATGLLLAGAPYFAEHVLGEPAMTGALVTAFVLPNLFTTGAWRRYARRHGTERAFAAASALFTTGCLLLLAAPVLPALFTPLVLLIVGTGHAGQLLFLYAMLAQTAADGAARTGTARAGALSGLFSAGETLGLALAPFLFALVLQVSGYVSSDSGQALAQSGTARAGILLGMAVLPALATVTGYALLHRGRRRGTAPAPRATAA
ncbi:MFS transporter [Streptomyces sp. NPDC097619]|uniref:MFS transporter n=1 Tax=Streptomyces sp. NPDC097619 TaxID=3157228 RepID=UPI00332CB623